MLRQGRGEGFRRALEQGGDGVAEVVACVLDDPRWDRQIEERDDYYARLLLALKGHIEPIASRLLEDDSDRDHSDSWLPLGVLVQLCRRAHGAAIDAVGQVVARSRHWRACLDALAAYEHESLVQRTLRPDIIAALLTRVSPGEVAEAIHSVQPWERWAQEVPSLRFLLPDRRGTDKRTFLGHIGWFVPHARAPELRELDRSMSTKQLLDALVGDPMLRHCVIKLLRPRDDLATHQMLVRAAGEGTVEQQSVVLPLLGERADASFVDPAVEFLSARAGSRIEASSDSTLRQAYSRYLAALPGAVTLPLARRWFEDTRPRSMVAQDIFRRHATLEDRPMLEAAGRRAMRAKEFYRLSAIVEGVDACRSSASVPFLIDVICQAEYSWTRVRALRALASHAPLPEVEPFIVEALWDCEPEAREIAIAVAKRSNLDVVRRAQEIVGDAFEDESVRRVAGA